MKNKEETMDNKIMKIQKEKTKNKNQTFKTKVENIDKKNKQMQ